MTDDTANIEFADQSSRSSYDPQAAVNYAEAWWNGRNPAYHDYSGSGGDCANFVSQCLIAGGLDLSAGPGVDGRGCIPSVVNLDYNLRHYQNTQYQVGGSEPLWVVKGDPILFYSNDGTHHHSAFGVVGDASHYWHGNAHTMDCYHKPISWFLSDPNLDYCVYFHIKGVIPVQPPSAPTITSPGSDSSPGPEIDILTPTLQWNAASDADYYAIAIRKDPPGGPIVYNPQEVYGTSHPVPSGILENGHEYRWNMQAHNSAGWSDISNTLYFQTPVGITDQQKQQEILNIVNSHRGSLPAELVLAIIRQGW